MSQSTIIEIENFAVVAQSIVLLLVKSFYGVVKYFWKTMCIKLLLLFILLLKEKHMFLSAFPLHEI